MSTEAPASQPEPDSYARTAENVRGPFFSGQGGVIYVAPQTFEQDLALLEKIEQVSQGRR